jgi:uncharacterized protein with HEPN domain
MVIGISNEKLCFKTRKKVHSIKWNEIKRISKIKNQSIIILKDNNQIEYLNFISQNLRNIVINKYFKIKNIKVDSNSIQK